MIRKSLKEHYKHLFLNEKSLDTVKKQQILFTLKDTSINSIEDALAIILAFNIVHAFLNNTNTTMLQQAYKGEKVKGNSKANINIGKEIDFTKLVNPSGLNLKNPNVYANKEKDEVNNVSNVRKFIDLTDSAISWLEDNGYKGAILEKEDKLKINRMNFNIEASKLLDGKLKALVDEDNEKINITNLIKYFKDKIEKFLKNNASNE